MASSVTLNLFTFAKSINFPFRRVIQSTVQMHSPLPQAPARTAMPLWNKFGEPWGKWPDCRMRRDVKRRRRIKEWGPVRLRINAIRKNEILPADLRATADAEIHALPADGRMARCHTRCIVSSRPRGLLRRWRISRFVWRHMADYNKLSGVTRACW